MAPEIGLGSGLVADLVPVDFTVELALALAGLTTILVDDDLCLDGLGPGFLLVVAPFESLFKGRLYLA